MPKEVMVGRLCEAYHWTTEEAYRMLSPPWRRRTVAALDALRIANAIDEFARVEKSNAKKAEQAAKKNKSSPEVAMAQLEKEGGLEGADISRDTQTFMQYVIDCARTLTDEERRLAMRRRRGE